MIKIKSFLFFTTISLLISCSKDMTLNSNDIDDKTERIETLKNNVLTYSEIKDTEFDLFNSSGFGRGNLMPEFGPTDIYYVYAVKISPNDITKWKEDLVEITGKIEEEKWISNLIKKRNKSWVVNSNPKFYKKNENQTLIFFENEGIIFNKIELK